MNSDTNNYCAMSNRRFEFEKKMETHFKGVKGLCLRYMKNEELAMEVAQDAFLKAYKEIGSLSHLDKFKPWVHKIAKNLCINKIKKSVALREHRREYQVVLTNSPCQTDHFVEGITESKMLIEKVLAHDLDTTILLFQNKVMGLTIGELAVSYGTSESSIKMRIHRYKKNMRNEKYCDQVCL